MNPQHTEFMAVTHQRYCSMQRRFGKIPFSITRFREFIIDLLGGEHGLTRCEYCNTPLDLLRLQLDHRMPPLFQNGSLGLDNLAACCEPCNQQKGCMSAPAFLALRNFAYSNHNFTAVDRTDLFGRLQSQLKLAILNQTRIRKSNKSNRVRITPHQRRSA